MLKGSSREVHRRGRFLLGPWRMATLPPELARAVDHNNGYTVLQLRGVAVALPTKIPFRKKKTQPKIGFVLGRLALSQEPS